MAAAGVCECLAVVSVPVGLAGTNPLVSHVRMWLTVNAVVRRRSMTLVADRIALSLILERLTVCSVVVRLTLAKPVLIEVGIFDTHHALMDAWARTGAAAWVTGADIYVTNISGVAIGTDALTKRVTNGISLAVVTVPRRRSNTPISTDRTTSPTIERAAIVEPPCVTHTLPIGRAVGVRRTDIADVEPILAAA